MNEKQIKRLLQDNGLTIADVARELVSEFPQVKETSADVMLRELIAGRRWYPAYVDWLRDRYGVRLERPSWYAPVRERMREKLAA